jgi:hypothetical protein
MLKRFVSTSRTGRRHRSGGSARALVLGLGIAVVSQGQGHAQSKPQTAAAPAAAPSSAGPQTPADLAAALQEGIKLHNEFQYAPAIAALDRVIASLSPSDTAQREGLVRAYEYRARARYALNDSGGAEADFDLVLRLRPDYQPDPGISPTVRGVFTTVRSRLVGDVVLQVTPAGEVSVDGYSYVATAEPLNLALLAGDHTIAAKHLGYKPAEERVTVTAGGTLPVTLALERTSATLTVRTIPDGVDVLLNGVPKGVTPKSRDANGPSAPLVIGELNTGSYVMRYEHDCYKPLERSITIAKLDDTDVPEPVRLEPAVATVTLKVSEPGYTIFMDGRKHGTAPADLTTVCEGQHAIEIRSARGRYIDKRYWRTGDVETLNAALRPAVAIVINTPPAGVSPVEFISLVERGLAGANGALIFAPADEELSAALRADNVTGDLFHGNSATVALRRRDIGERVAARLGVQGIAAIESTGSPDSVRLSLLAAGSAEPEFLTFDLNSVASRANAVTALTAEIPPLLRVSIDALLIDVAGTPGAVVVRAAPGGAAGVSGLAAGDVITESGGAAVNSVADLWAHLNGKQGQSVPLGVRSAAGTTRSASVVPKLVPDTIPMADRHLLYNGLLLRLQDLLLEAKTPTDATAVRLNLAIVEMRLGRWREAAGNLEQLKLPDGPGVSSGTVAYLMGLCYEALGRRAEATASFTTAAKSDESALSSHGPHTAPLAQERLQTPPAAVR